MEYLVCRLPVHSLQLTRMFSLRLQYSNDKTQLANSLWFIFLFSFVRLEVLALLNSSYSWGLNLADRRVTGQGGLFLNNLVTK